MSGESRSGAGKDQDQMRDQDAFRDDPRGRQEVGEQQPETQPGDPDGKGTTPGDAEDEPRGQAGRDDASEASGNPPNAG